MLGNRATNRFVRDTTDAFYQAQATRVADPRQMPRYAYMPAPLGPDTVVHPRPRITYPDELGLPPMIQDIHEA